MKTMSMNPAVRIRPPSALTNGQWVAEDFNDRKVYALPELAVAIIFYCIKPQEKEKTLCEFSHIYDDTPTAIEILINTLIEKNVLITDKFFIENYQNFKLLYKKYNRWDECGWGSAAEYHFFTMDYPFLDYSKQGNGSQIIKQRMQDYSAENADTCRVKIYPENYKRVSLPCNFNETKTDLKIKNYKLLNLDSISVIIAIAFSKTSESPITSWQGTPLIRRTSPSGGSRHPTEGYLFTTGITGLKEGLYHIQSDPFCLVSLSSSLPRSIATDFPDFYKHSDSIPDAIILLTSVFYRNMFRYREPRTFRTVHMDAGHIAGTIELITKQLGMKAVISHQMDEPSIENFLNLDGMSEGIMTSVGIFNL